MTNAPRPAATVPRRSVRAALVVPALLALAACGDGPMFPTDWDLRSRESLTTADAARAATVPRPRGDDRGVISYPGYQVVVARRGDTVRAVAGRIGVGADALASRNAIQPDVVLQGGEVLLVPGRVAEPTLASGAAPAAPVDVAAIATTALDRAQGTAPAAAAPPRPVVQAGAEPLRHRVLRGESAYTIARRYNVPVRALAEWNGLTGDFTVREGQTLLIPPFAETPPPATAATTAPGSGSPTPTPPSAARPLPAERTAPAATPVATPPSPDLAAGRTAASASRFAMPADGAIIRAFTPARPGIDIGAPAGAPVRAAADGTVLRVTRETNGITLVLLRHADDLVTVYANIADVTVAQGASVRRGQQIARVAPGAQPFLRFDVRRGVDAVDPAPFLN
ncbi:MAG: peptidoglycan DD-metalloendopeptidase family protein [Gemmobacter sp.]